jgi:hypothetical protein
MPRLPARFAAVILCFAPLVFQRSWRHAEVLLVGAILMPGRRTGPAHRDRHPAGCWARPGAAVRELSSHPQLVLQARRRMPDRPSVPVTGSGFSALEFLAAPLRQGIARVTRPRLDAALHEPAPPRRPGTVGRPRTKGRRLPTPAEVLADRTTRWRRAIVPGRYGEGDRAVEIHSGTAAVRRHAGPPAVPIRRVLPRDPRRRFDPQALLRTGPVQEPLRTIRCFVRRWRLEVTFREVRDHLGVETRRRWSDKAIARTTPCPLGLFSVVTPLASRLDRRARVQVSTGAWYRKQRRTFADTLAVVRRANWREQGFVVSWPSAKTAKLPPALREGIAYALRHAA